MDRHRIRKLRKSNVNAAFNCCSPAGRRRQSRSCTRRSGWTPDISTPHQALGAALMQSGRFADASQILLRALALRPDSAAAWRQVGASYDRQNLHQPAIEAYRRAVELAPKLGNVLCRLGELYTMYSRMDEASDCYERAADIDPDTTKARLLRSDARMLQGDISDAERWAREAVALEPASNPAHGTLAGLLYAQGRFEEAAMSFEAALRLDPKAARCWHGLADCRKFSESDNSILDRMRVVLQRDDLNDAERMTMHFAVGKVYDDCGDYAHAMEHFDRRQHAAGARPQIRSGQL